MDVATDETVNAENGVVDIADGDGMDRLLTWHDGERAFSPFSDVEMDSRQDALREHMSRHEIDACLLTSYHNICYFSGFLYCAFGRYYGFVMTRTQATTISAGIDGGQPWRMTHGDNVAYTDWRRDNFFYAVQQLTLGVRRLGIEFDHVNIDLRAKLEAALPDVELVDVGRPTMWMRTIKSDEEIAHIQTLTRIADIGGQACVETIGRGVPEHEVALAATGAMVREIANSFPFVELIRPGARCGDIAAELNEIYRGHDLLKYRSFATATRSECCAITTGEAGVELREDIETRLEPGMVVSMEPMIMIPEGRAGAGGYREHDILVVTEHGAENITDFPYGPEHNIVEAS